MTAKDDADVDDRSDFVGRARATVHDVARVAGVSAMTVSRVLNRSAPVAPDTAERVRAAMVEVGFRLNHSARNLRSGRTTPMIGLVVDDMANPFHASLGRAVEDVARGQAALLVVASGGDELDRQREVVTTLLERGVDGLLMYPASGRHDYLNPELLEGRPVVFLGRRPAGLDRDLVQLDNLGGAILATEHLISYGHRRIGLIAYGHGDAAAGDPASDHLAGRVEGYRRAHRSAGLDQDPALVRLGCSGVDEAAEATRAMLALADPPTALFPLNNRMTVGALRALGPGLRRIALLGFDDFELAEVFDPPVSVVRQDPRAIGRQAASVLFRRLAGWEGAPVHITLPMALVERGSAELSPAR